MWVAGIGWRDSRYELVVVDGQGDPVAGPVAFDGRGVGELIGLLRDHAARAGGALACVVESTNGTLDGHLMAAGLSVYRADPPGLPPRPAHGSVPAAALAGCDPARLAPLTPGTGSLGGREAEYAEAVASSAGAERELGDRFLVHGDGNRPDVALTFDDGPHGEFTPRVLDILAGYGIPATFFCVGLCAAAYPDLVERIAAAGHGLGNHTWSHPYLPDLSRDEVLRQLDATGEAVAAATGTVPALVRPPYGSRTPDVLRWFAGHGLTTVLWDVDAHDWAAPGTDRIVSTVTGAVVPGSVVLMHDAGGDRGQTVAALPRIVEDLLARGFRFTRVDALHAPNCD